MNIEFQPSVMPDIRRKVNKILKHQLHLLPTWVQIVKVWWDDNNTEQTAAACAVANMEYRTFHLTINHHFMSLSDREAWRILLHEVAHAYNYPMADVTAKSLNHLSQDLDVIGFHAENIRAVIEGSTQDLAMLFLKWCPCPDNFK